MRTHKLTFVIALVALAAGLRPASLLGQAARHRASTDNIASNLSGAQWPGQGSARGRGHGLGPKCDVDAQIGQTLFDDNGGETTLMIGASLPFCPWQITGAPPWITLTQSSGFGDASVGVLVESLPNVSRYADLLVADTRIRIYQQPPLTLAANCSPTARRGVHHGLICFVVVRPWPNEYPTADLTVFGGSDRSYIPYSLADGVFDLLFTIPGDFPLGPVEIPFRVEDMWGNVATAIGRFEVIP